VGLQPWQLLAIPRSFSSGRRMGPSSSALTAGN
jgi:hypothetical protein